MKGLRFFRDHDTNAKKRAGEHNGGCIAVYLDDRGRPLTTGSPAGMVNCHAAVFSEKNSTCCGCSISLDYLRKHCTRIPEAEARRIHPQLFALLDWCDRCHSDSPTKQTKTVNGSELLCADCQRVAKDERQRHRWKLKCDAAVRAGMCGRCTSTKATTTVHTRSFGRERLCAGCAKNVRLDGQEIAKQERKHAAKKLRQDR